MIYIDGTRLNGLRAVHKWFVAGRKLVKTSERLESDPDSGFLGHQPAFTGLGTGVAVQYWRSLADLKRLASDRDDRHVPAWRWYNETLFRSVHPIGPGAVAELVPTSDHRRRPGLSE